MKGKITVKDSGSTYLPKAMVKEGFVGEVATLADAVTVLLMKPDAPLEQIQFSLETLMRDIQLRIQMEQMEQGVPV